MEDKKQYVLLRIDDGKTGLYGAPSTYKNIKDEALGWKRLVPSCILH